MKVIKIHNIVDPGTEYVRWVSTPPLFDVDIDSTINDQVPMDIHEGKKTSFRYYGSNRKLEFVLDLESDVIVAQECFREFYELALDDVADMLGTTRQHLIERLFFHNTWRD